MNNTSDLSASVDKLLEDLHSGNRRLLAKTLSFVESTRDEDVAVRDAFLARLRPKHTTQRIALSGPPGAGKSTLIEHLGLSYVATGSRVAVVAIDPSSVRSGGSILGDKVRMPELSANDRAFVRPSASATTLGGTAPRTREVMMVLEAAGYDRILLETVGVGQSEIHASDMVDLFVYLTTPAGGDDIQAVKRGIMEVADIIVVNKADTDRARTQKTIGMMTALRSLLHSKISEWQVPCLPVSALHREGIEELRTRCDAFFEQCAKQVTDIRREQRGLWFDELVTERILQRFFHRAEHRTMREALRSDVVQGSREIFDALSIILTL